MEITSRFEIVEASQVGEARRAAAAIARTLGFSAGDGERVSIVATELGTNLAKHAEAGELLVLRRRRAGIDLLSIDRGPGTDNAGAWLRDGFSTSGSPGTGLGAVSRLSDAVDIFSMRGEGTVVLAQIRPRGDPAPRADALRSGGLAVALRGESASGDCWGARVEGSRGTVVLADGLGHGPDAALASTKALSVFYEAAERAPALLLDGIGERLRETRGAAVAVATVDSAQGAVRFAGIGNVSGVIVADDEQHSLVSYNGIVGRNGTKPRELSYRWPENGLLVMHSDGLRARWRLADYPGLRHRSPSVIAGVLYRDFARAGDDVSVAVLSQAPARLDEGQEQ